MNCAAAAPGPAVSPNVQAQTASGRRHAVVSGHPLATEHALAVLDAGGNVIDAAIAGAATLTVVLPHACSPGGDLFALLHRDGVTHGINGSGASPAHLPAGLPPEKLAGGALSCAVPGVVGAWEAMHARFGTLPWLQLFAQAVATARSGFTPSPDLLAARRVFDAGVRGDPGCNALYGEVAEGRPLLQAALGATLEQIAREGACALYQGAIGERLCAAVQERGGVLAREDLAAYRPKSVDALEYTYRGHAVRAMPPNSYGLYMLLQLAALEGVDLGALPRGTAARVACLIRAARAAFNAGDAYVLDPAKAPDAREAFAADRLRALRDAVRTQGDSLAGASRANGTAVISVADAAGNGITLVQSVFMPFGAMVADTATGIVINNRLLGFSTEPGHPNAPGPRKRPAHTLNPVIVVKDGRLRFLMGTPGGSGQTLTLTQVLTHCVDDGLGLAEAIAAPRWSMDLKGNALIEPEMATGTLEALAAQGIAARDAGSQRSFFGSAECIAFEPDGTLTAAADFRRDAHAGAA